MHAAGGVFESTSVHHSYVMLLFTHPAQCKPALLLECHSTVWGPTYQQLGAPQQAQRPNIVTGIIGSKHYGLEPRSRQFCLS